MSECNEKPMVFVLPARKVNRFQVETIERTIKRAKQAHYTNVQIRINGEFETEEADWLKHLELQP